MIQLTKQTQKLVFSSVVLFCLSACVPEGDSAELDAPLSNPIQSAHTAKLENPLKQAALDGVLPEALWPVKTWQETYDSLMDQDNQRALPRSLSGDAWQHYELAYYVDATNAMFRATADTSYLDIALIYITNVIQSARPVSEFGSQFQDNYLGWGGPRIPPL